MSYFTFKNGETPLNDTNLNNMQDAIKEDIETSVSNSASLSERLIYSKVTTETDANGFDITSIKLVDGKQYKVIVDGALEDTNGSGESGVLRLVPQGSDSSIIRNTIIIGQSDESVRHYFSSSENIKLIRSYGTYGAVGETLLSYKNRIIKAMTNSVGLGQTEETCINTRVGTMMGYYDGDITALHFEPSDDFTIITGTIIKIFELP